jgi:hypothetical protein
VRALNDGGVQLRVQPADPEGMDPPQLAARAASAAVLMCAAVKDWLHAKGQVQYQHDKSQRALQALLAARQAAPVLSDADLRDIAATTEVLHAARERAMTATPAAAASAAAATQERINQVGLQQALTPPQHPSASANTRPPAAAPPAAQHGQPQDQSPAGPQQEPAPAAEQLPPADPSPRPSPGRDSQNTHTAPPPRHPQHPAATDS